MDAPAAIVQSSVRPSENVRVTTLGGTFYRGVCFEKINPGMLRVTLGNEPRLVACNASIRVVFVLEGPFAVDCKVVGG
jgi:hypothetical protein